MKPRNRRAFLQDSAAVAAAAGISALRPERLEAQSAASAANVPGSNDRIRIGLIGCGGMGQTDLRDFLKNTNVQCVALGDVDDSQSAATREWVNRLDGQKPELITRDFRFVLDRKDIDAVIVGTPDHWHALPTIMACQAGKDVYVEKPLAISIGEGRAMVRAARQHNRIVQMGTQQRSAPHYAEAVEYVRSGRLGQIRLVRAWAYQGWMGNIPKVPDSDPPPGVDYDMWLGPARKRPFNKNRFHFNFRWYWDYSGGLMTDWGAHMIDIANWAMGVKTPTCAVSMGGKFGFPDDAEETPDTQQALWSYPGFTMLWEHATAINRGPEARDHGVEFHGNNGTLVVDRAGWEVAPEVVKVDGKSQYKLAAFPRQNVVNDQSHQAHVNNFLDCMRSRELPRSDVEIGHYSMIACHLGNIAFRLGRQVCWDTGTETIINDAEAATYVTRAYRAPWKLPC
jgi:predicted dehydrogenase